MQDWFGRRMGCGALLIALSCLGSALFAQTPVLRPDGHQIEIAAPTSGGLLDDADHAQCAVAPTGDIVVVWRAKGPADEPKEVHATYFSFVRNPTPAWIPSESIVLASGNALEQGCSLPDVEFTYDPGDQGNGRFVVVWGRLNKSIHAGALEAALIGPPSLPSFPPEVVYADGVSGAVLDPLIDTRGGSVRPEIAWHEGLGLGHFGVIYNHRTGDTGSSVTLDLRWIEAQLPSVPGTPQILNQCTLVPDVELYGLLYDRGSFLPPAVQFMTFPANSSQLRLVVAYEESTGPQVPAQDEARITLESFRFTPASTPVPQVALHIEPDVIAEPKNRYFHRPKLAWNGDTSNGEILRLAFFALEDDTFEHHGGLAYTVNFTNGSVERAAWTSGTSKQGLISPFAINNAFGVVFTDQDYLYAAAGSWKKLIDVPGPVDLGTLPDVQWLTDVDGRGRDLIVLASHWESVALGTDIFRPRIQCFLVEL